MIEFQSESNLFKILTSDLDPQPSLVYTSILIPSKKEIKNFVESHFCIQYRLIGC